MQQDEIEKSYSDQIGCLSFISALGNKYAFVLNNYNDNIILTEPLASRCAAKIKKRRKKC